MEGKSLKFKNKVLKEKHSHKHMFRNPFKGIDCLINKFDLKVVFWHVPNNYTSRWPEICPF